LLCRGYEANIFCKIIELLQLNYFSRYYR
jgi:hypothetical protein